MKVVVLAASMLFGMFVYAEAKSSMEVVKNDVVAVATQQQDGYEEVKIENLNAKVQAAIKTNEATNTVKSLAYNKSKKLTKVTLVSKADKKEKTIILDDQGQEVKDKLK